MRRLAQSICRDYWLGRGRYSRRATKRKTGEVRDDRGSGRGGDHLESRRLDMVAGQERKEER